MQVCKQHVRLRRPLPMLAGLMAALFLTFGNTPDATAADTTPLPLPPASVLPLYVGGLFGASSSSDDGPRQPAPAINLAPAAAPRPEQRVINPLDALSPYLPGPGEWRQVPSLQFDRFGLTDQEANVLGIRGTTGSAAVLSQQTGSAYDPEGFLWYFWGGGSDAYGGNEVYRLDLTIPLMSQLTQPSTLDMTVTVQGANNCFAPSDGPAAGSTFDGSVWSPATQSFFVFPTGAYCPGGTYNQETVWEFDPLAGTWDSVAGMTGMNGPVFAEYDSVSGLIYIVEAGANATLRDFDPVTGQLGVRVSLGKTISAGNTVLDTASDRLIVFAQEGVYAVSLSSPGTISRLADLPRNFDPTSGAALDKQRGIVAFWAGGKTVRSFDTSSNEWTEEIASAGPTAGPGGVFSKWVAIKELGILAGYHNPAEGLWLYRLPTTLSAPSPGNSAPIALVDANQISVHAGDVVNLDGSSSFDANGDTLSFAWSTVTAPAGNTPTLTTPNQATASFTPAVDGSYDLRLTVSDGVLSDSTTVTVTAGNTVPAAAAGQNQSVQVGQTATLSGSGSSDAEGDILSYSWTFTAVPTGSTASLTGDQTVSPSFSPDLEGTYSLSLTVSDGIASASDTVDVSATAAPVNQAPVANAGPDQTLTEGQTASLTGLQSLDPDGDSLTYAWTLTQRPTGSSASFSNATASQPTLALDVAGAYVASLTVNDGSLNSTADQISITANASSGGGTGVVIHIFPGDSFENAAEALVPGDTLIVHSGTYADTGRISIQVSGTAAAPVIIKGADGETRPVITRPSSASVQNTINVEGAAYLTIKGLEVIGNGGDGIKLSNVPTNITIEDLVIHDIDVGINFSSNMSGIVIRKNDIYNTGIFGGTGEGMYVGCNNNACAVSETIIENNLIHDSLPSTSQGDGIEVKPGSYNVIVRNNVIHDMSYPCIMVYGNGPARNIVEGNVLWNCNEAIQAVSDAVVRNNIIFNSGTGINAAPHVQVPQMDNMTIVNNTIYGHSSECLYIRWSGATNMVLANNAVYCAGSQAVNAGGLSGADITVRANYVEGGMSGASIDNVAFVSGGSVATALTDVAGFDFWPLDTSVLVGTADSNHMPTIDFNGTTRTNPHDVGAYETEGLATNPGWKIADTFKGDQAPGGGTPNNRTPVADAGPDQTLVEGQTAALTGLQSSDPDGDSLSYAWTLTQRPSGSTASLSNTAASQPTLALDVAGTYVAILRVNDGVLTSTASQVQITAEIDTGTAGGPINVALTASPLVIAAGQTTTLSWSSTDATSCTASGGWSGSKAVNGNQTVSPTTTTVYSMSCTGTSGSAQSGVSVIVGNSTNIVDNLQPGHWFEAPNSRLDSVDPCPARNCSYTGTLGVWGLMGAWGSGAYDTKRDRLIVWGGGHQDYGGNELYAFDVNALQWQRLTEPSTSITGDTDYYPDGLPTTRHTYDFTDYLPGVDRFCTAGGAAVWGSGAGRTPQIDCYSFGNVRWENYGTVPFSETGAGGVSAVDAQGNLWSHGTGDQNNHLAKFDPQTNTRTEYVSDGALAIRYVATIDTVQNKMYAIGIGELLVWDLNNPNSPRQVLSTSGATEIQNATYAGIAYHTPSGKIVAWAGGASMYWFDPNTRVWTRETPAAGNTVVAPSAESNGTFGRFRYVPSKDVFIVANQTDNNVFFYKMKSSPPPAPAAPTVALSAAPSSISSGQASVLSWSSANATSCSAGGGWTSSSATSGSQSVSPTQTTNYAISCTGTGGSTSQSVTVTVSAPPGPGTLPVGTLAHDGPATPEQISLILPVTGTLPQTATASVRYRQAGAQAWTTGHPLYRVRPEFSLTPVVGSVPDVFAWPIIDLTPGATYEVEVTIVSGTTSDTRTASFTTRTLPAPAGAPNKFVAAGSSQAQIQTVLDSLVPGDVLEFDNGTYNVSTLFIARSGTRSNPIYIRGRSRAGVTISSGGVLFQLLDTSYVTLENMTLQGSGVDSGTSASSRGIEFWNGAPNQTQITVRNVTINGVDMGIVAYAEISEFLAYDNTIIGNNQWIESFLTTNTTWNDDGIRIPGFGNVAFNNTLESFGDTLSFAAHSGPSTLTQAVGVHFYRNDVRNSGDDFTEIDHGHRNLTVYDNRSHNAMTFVSLDPLYGGPVIVARNIIINVGRTPFKWNSTNSGQFIYNNTIVRTTGRHWIEGGPTAEAGWYQPNNGPQRAYGYRNNILVYRGAGNQTLRLDNPGHDIVDFTHNSWYPDLIYQWPQDRFSNLADANNRLADITPVFSGTTRRHDADNITTANPWTTTVTLGADYRIEVTGTYIPLLAPGSAPKNSGVVIPNITDNYSGSAPDRGAVIEGRTLPLYGQR